METWFYIDLDKLYFFGSKFFFYRKKTSNCWDSGDPFKGPMPRRTYGFARNHENQWRTWIRRPKYFVMTENTLERYLECLREVSGGKCDPTAIQRQIPLKIHYVHRYLGIEVSWGRIFNFRSQVGAEKSKITKIGFNPTYIYISQGLCQNMSF